MLSSQEEAVASEHVLQLESSSRCISYDFEFVAAAQQLAVPRVTEDRAILAAFPDVALSLHQGGSWVPAFEARRSGS